MAEVSFFNLSEQDLDETDDQFDQQNRIIGLDSLPGWSLDFDIYTSDLDPPHQPRFDFDLNEVYEQDERSHGVNGVFDLDSDSRSTVDLFNRGNQVNSVMDSLEEYLERSFGEIDLMFDRLNRSSIGIVERNDEMNSNNLELDLGLGFGGERDSNYGFMIDESGNDFFVGRRRIIGFGSENDTDDDETSTICGPEPFLSSFPVLEFESDLDSEDDADFELGHVHDDNTHWESFQLENNEDFEWEEVDERIEGREILNMVLDDWEESPSPVNISPENQLEELRIERDGESFNIGWEVVLDMGTLNTNPRLDHDDYDPYFSDHETLFGQFTENESSIVGRPPASKSAIQNLPNMITTREDVEKNNSVCAVCKDEMNVGEIAKQLPCFHRYHGECILPWLGIRNTCPVCRYELITDDDHYNRRRILRAGRGM